MISTHQKNERVSRLLWMVYTTVCMMCFSGRRWKKTIFWAQLPVFFWMILWMNFFLSFLLRIHVITWLNQTKTLDFTMWVLGSFNRLTAHFDKKNYEKVLFDKTRVVLRHFWYLRLISRGKVFPPHFKEFLLKQKSKTQ